MALYTVETYGELTTHLAQEWLITNGIGGFACGTIVGCNTRRYHGLLIAAQNPPVGRVSLLSRIGEIIKPVDDSRSLEFSCNQFSQVFHPRGDRYLQRFEFDHHIATWVYHVEEIVVTKQLLMPWMRNAVGVRYQVDPMGRTVELSLLPFVRLLDFHALRRGNANFQQSQTNKSCTVRDGNNQVVITSSDAEYVASPDWWYGHTYAIESERGLDDTEDLFTPGKFVARFSKPTTITLWASADGEGALDWEAQLAQRKSQEKSPPKASAVVTKLSLAASDYIVARKTPKGEAGTSVIAGYPWFADWGRDTMISLPGLLLVNQRFEEARQVLCLFAQYVSEGMIPNKFDDYTNQPSYNTVDASLWFIHACFEYARLSGDTRTLNESLRPACMAIVDGYTRGTRYGIGVDPQDGLVAQGSHDTQLTWMDAMCQGIAFTPRQGKPVEINALWHHALSLLGLNDRAAQVATTFRQQFWISPFRGLADVVIGKRRDCAIRPNQIFAVSLEPSLLEPAQQAAVVETVRRELLTPVGLRTLSRDDPQYHRFYRGTMRQRDQAYHNGTVWPWLIGAFLQAYVRVNDRSNDSLDQARRWLTPLVDSMRSNCLGQISEIFEPEEPHRAVGCFAQAWSVAEVLRLAVDLGM